ncbi:MAG: hypothetical protein LBU47_05835 [Christensenellaceae bacterium]|jgi:hypothetical protein|nr:hypothetical protein [Christensenellaceae bacterium]
MKRTAIPGGLLLVFGVYFFLMNLLNLPPISFFIAIGAGFLLSRALSCVRGLVIPGFLLFCIGIGLTLCAYFPAFRPQTPSIFILALSLGFLLIHIAEHQRMGVWPLIVAISLFALGLVALVAGSEALRAWLRPYIGYILSALLVAAGLVMLLLSLGRPKKERSTRAIDE